MMLGSAKVQLAIEQAFILETEYINAVLDFVRRLRDERARSYGVFNNWLAGFLGLVACQI
jgi:hypothetical protein